MFRVLVVVTFLAVWTLPSLVLAGPGYWTQRGAQILPQGRGELMVLGPSRYAVSERTEVGVGLFSFAALPNVQLKWAWADQVVEDGRDTPWSVAWRHRVLLPGFLYELTTAQAPAGVSSWLDVVVGDTDVVMTRVVEDGVWDVCVGGVAAMYTSSWGGAPATFQEEAPLLLWHRAPITENSRFGWGARGRVSRRQYMGRQGWFVHGEGALHIFPVARQVGVELDARVGLERRHFFLEFGARTAGDGVHFETLPLVEFGVAFE